MNVAELIARLQELPQDRPVLAYDYRAEQLAPVKFAWGMVVPDPTLNDAQDVSAVVLSPFDFSEDGDA